MAEDDIYGNQAAYEGFIAHLDRLVVQPAPGIMHLGKAKYWCRNPANLRYFRQLIPLFDTKDSSYIHRLRMMRELLLTTTATGKELSECTRDDINGIIAFMHTQRKSAKSKEDYIKHIKWLWKTLFPEKDLLGRIDEGVVPYPVRHLTPHVDRSKLHMREDRLTWAEFRKIVDYFAHDRRVQAYIMLAMESLGRPQELLTRKIKHVEIHDCYAKVWLTEHGKEGPGLLQCIDSFPYIVRWLDEHPFKDDPEAYVFINTGATERGQMMSPENMNKHIRLACSDLGILKRITCYSMKRNGVTFRRLRGDSDLEIQHAARWASLQQLKTYDLSRQEDAFQAELMKRGIVKPDGKNAHIRPASRQCIYCGHLCGFTEQFCPKCKRPLDRKDVMASIREDEQFRQDFEMMRRVIERLRDHLPADIVEGLASAGMKGGG